MFKDHYDLFGVLDKHITRERFASERDSTHFYPSEASVTYFDEHGDLTTVGGCLRATYFRMSGQFEQVADSAYSQWIFRMGKMIEEIIVSEAKEAGLWVANNVKFIDKKENISGEIDVVLREPDGTEYISEIKSIYGYYANKEVFGDKHHQGFPKKNQLLQLLIYLWKFQDRFPYGRMAYFSRDSGKKGTFFVRLVNEGNITYPEVDGRLIRSFTINDIINRYRQCQKYFDQKIVPPCDYELQYPDEKIEDFYKKKKISKSKYEKWKGKKLKKYEFIGNWECNFCKYRYACHSDKLPALSELNSIETVEED